ncbi:MAG TPA: S8 family serine peptidase [Solirubrobacterales bacterium]|nr:S8 family serine peptidase [Solirubrobacterales bacterium]
MLQGLSFNRFFPRSLLLALVLASSLPAFATAAAPAEKNHGPLSPLLSKLADPAVAEESPAAQDELLGVTSEGPGSVIRDGERVQVTVRFAAGAVSALPQLREAGAAVVGASRDQQTVTLAVAPDDLAAVASVPGVRAVWQARRPVLYAAGSCEGGSVISEGLGQLRVDQAREAFGLRGTGITVGVLSDSYDAASEAAAGGPIATHAAQDVATNDLPGPASGCSDQQLPVDVLAEGGPEGADEGRAMLQIVHDLAPHARLAFATAFESEESFAQNIERLARPVAAGGAGADVIVDDVAWFEEPFFQDGPVAAAIDKVTAEGVTYLSAAGNDNLVDSGGHDIASWETSSFRDAGGCPATVLLLSGFNGKHCLDFDPSEEADTTFGITVEAGETLTVDLQWGEPWYGVNTDLDAFLLSGTGNILAQSVEDNSGPKGTQRPVEIVQWTNSAGSSRTVQLAVNRFSGGDPRVKFILMENGGGVTATEYPASNAGDVVGPSVFGHAGSASAVAVAAVPFNNSTRPERYSSRGPVVHLFGPVEGTTPAPGLGSPETIAKPDVAATDCGATTFFASLSAGTWRFCGTSAAAPHAAAVAALLRQANPALSPQDYEEALTSSAASVGAYGSTAVGGGLVDASSALASLPGPVTGEDGPSTSVAPLAATAGPALATGGSSGSTSPESAARAAPQTTLRKHPRKLVRTRSRTVRAVFAFGSDQAGSGFLCQVDGGRVHSCGERLVRRFRLGAHTVAVRAVDSAGVADATPAVFRFRVKHVS